MYKYKEESVTETKKVATEVICNKCGKVEKAGETDDEIGYFVHDMTSLILGFGYGSCYDTDVWKMELCDKCIEEFVSSFKIAPKGFFQYPETLIMEDYTEEGKTEIFNEWKENKKINWLEKVKTKETAANMLNIFDEDGCEYLKGKFDITID